MKDFLEEEEKRQERAKKVVKKGFEAMLDKAHIADKIIELDESYDKLDLIRCFSTEELKRLRSKLKEEA